MEISQLRYFTAVARHENMHAAAREIHASLGSLSHAITSLENELGIQLFQRLNRNIRLTPQGRALQSHALELLDREAAARFELSGLPGHLNVSLAGQEILCTEALARIEARIKKSASNISFSITNRDNAKTITAIENGEALLGMITGEPPTHLTGKKLFHASFKTCVSQDHPLYPLAKAGKSIPIQKVLEHSFATISENLLGTVDRYQSADGWRDDKFPRKIGFTVDSLHLLEMLVRSGKAIAYLPDYFAERTKLVMMNVSGCPYVCKHDVFLIARNPKLHSWMSPLF